MTVFTEQEIITGCKKQQRVIQEYLYKSYYSMFLKLCARYAKDMHDAEQLLQDGFLKIFNHIDTYQGNGSFEGWMKRIMVNTCLDFLKSKQQKNARQVSYPETMHDSLKVVSQNSGLEKLAMKDLLQLIQTLSPMSRMVFNLYIFEGFSHKEIAQMLEISEGTSQWHVNNARKNLQEKIKKRNNQEIKIYEQK